MGSTTENPTTMLTRPVYEVVPSKAEKNKNDKRHVTQHLHICCTNPAPSPPQAPKKGFITPSPLFLPSAPPPSRCGRAQRPIRPEPPPPPPPPALLRSHHETFFGIFQQRKVSSTERLFREPAPSRARQSNNPTWRKPNTPRTSREEGDHSQPPPLCSVSWTPPPPLWPR